MIHAIIRVLLHTVGKEMCLVLGLVYCHFERLLGSMRTGRLYSRFHGIYDSGIFCMWDCVFNFVHK